MAIVLRSLGNQLHPVGSLITSNYFLNPNLFLSTSGALNNWATVNCTFAPDPITPQIVGTAAGKFRVAATGSPASITQTVSVTQQDNWTMSAYLDVTTTLSKGVGFFADIYDSLGNFLETLGGTAIAGSTTGGWVHAAQTMTMPTVADHANFYVALVGNPTSLDAFYVNGLMLEKASVAGPYNDGNMSGYVWSGTPGVSTSIKTEFPDALMAFGTYPLQGGMGAGASMFAPQYATLVD